MKIIFLIFILSICCSEFEEILRLYSKGNLKGAREKILEVLQRDKHDIFLIDLLERFNLPPQPQEDITKPRQIEVMRELPSVPTYIPYVEIKAPEKLPPQEDLRAEIPPELKEYLGIYSFFEEGQWEIAKKKLTEFIQKHQKSEFREYFYFLLGLINWYMGNAAEAKEAFTQAQENSKILFYDILTWQAKAALKLGNIEDTISLCNQIEKGIKGEKPTKIKPPEAIQPYPRNKNDLLAESLLLLARAYEKKQDYQLSILKYQKFIEDFAKLKKDYIPVALIELAGVFEKTREFYKVYQTYLKIINEYPQSIFVDEAKQRADYIFKNLL